MRRLGAIRAVGPAFSASHHRHDSSIFASPLLKRLRPIARFARAIWRVAPKTERCSMPAPSAAPRRRPRASGVRKQRPSSATGVPTTNGGAARDARADTLRLASSAPGLLPAPALARSDTVLARRRKQRRCGRPPRRDRPLFQVGAGGEGLSFAGQEHGAHLRHLVQRRKSGRSPPGSGNSPRPRGRRIVVLATCPATSTEEASRSAIRPWCAQPPSTSLGCRSTFVPADTTTAFQRAASARVVPTRSSACRKPALRPSLPRNGGRPGRPSPRSPRR